MIASESSALSALGYEFEYDVDPGAAVIISESGVVEKSVCAESISHSPCLFEFVYFSRPDSVIDSISVHKSRLRMGDFLGDKILRDYSHLEIDAVIPFQTQAEHLRCRLPTSLALNTEKDLLKTDI